MQNIVAYVGSGFHPDELQKIVAFLRMRNITITDIKAHATIIIVPGDDSFMQHNINEVLCQKFHVPEVLQEIVIPETKQQSKKTFDNKCAIKQFVAKKQNYKQRFLTRTKCK